MVSRFFLGTHKSDNLQSDIGFSGHSDGQLDVFIYHCHMPSHFLVYLFEIDILKMARM